MTILSRGDSKMGPKALYWRGCGLLGAVYTACVAHGAAFDLLGTS
jgi:hypothetical protein